MKMFNKEKSFGGPTSFATSKPNQRLARNCGGLTRFEIITLFSALPALHEVKI
jgi:hypothetical protein